MTIATDPVDFEALIANLPEVSTTKDVAKVLQLTANGLHQARLAGKGPKFIKIGRLIRYLRPDVLDYLQRNRFDPQPPQPPGAADLQRNPRRTPRRGDAA
jgi:hypothetical protein